MVVTTSDTLTGMESALADTPAPLKIADRCDQCGAQAFVRVTLSTGELLFCGHHGNEHEPALVAQGAVIFRQPIQD